MFMRTFIYLLILSHALIGCSLSSRPDPTTHQLTQNPAELALSLEEQGNYQQAAHEYLRLAKLKTPPTRQGYQLSAIKALLKGGFLAEAKAELAKLNVDQSFGLEVPIKLVRAQIALAEHQPDDALQYLEEIDVNKLPASLRAEYHRQHAQVLEIKGDALNAVRERVRLERLSAVDPKTNHQAIWKNLSTLSPAALKEHLTDEEHTFAGWVALALLRHIVHPKQLPQAVSDWQRRFPDHPATQDIAQELAQNNLANPSKNKQIVLLLPVTESRFWPQAEAIREGFLAATYTEPEPTRPQVVIHHVDTDNVLEVYQTAVKAGADYVVGPLEKGPLTVLSNSYPQLPVPTLGLNYLQESTAPGNLYQLGLSPEDEANEVAQRALADGYRSAIALVPEGEWGERILSAFRTTWEKQGGQVTLALGYGDDYRTKVDQALQKSHTSDMAFMVVFPSIARQLRPFFNLHLSNTFPIYSTSHIYAGTPQPELDKDVDGVMFVDMPWVLAPDSQALQIQAELRRAWPEQLEQFKRLYALGMDAYTLLPRLYTLNKPQAALTWQGQTGRLSIDATGTLHRDNLVWARFINGEPRLVAAGKPLPQE